MKILYAIQGTGNGHLSRARDIIPLLREKGDLDLLVSGTQADVDLPYPVKYRFQGLSFIFGKKGGVDLVATYRKSNLKRLYNEIKQVPVEEYDLVINDFEPVSAWACRLAGKPCIGLSHQAAVINSRSPKPRVIDPVGKAILKNYAPVTVAYGFHFAAYDKSVFTPVIRRQIRDAAPRKEPHFTVYLPAYGDKRLLKMLGQLKEVQWEVFSKHTKKAYRQKNVWIRPVNNDQFVESLLHCTGILCGAGFETPAEALFLEKKLLVIPMKGQYEQQCNAAALAQMGVPVLKTLKEKHLETIRRWTTEDQSIPVAYPDLTDCILDRVIGEAEPGKTGSTPLTPEPITSAGKLRRLSLEKMLQKHRN